MKTTYFLRQKFNEKGGIVLHFCKSDLIEDGILLLYSFFCDMLFWLNDIKKFQPHTRLKKGELF